MSKKLKSKAKLTVTKADKKARQTFTKPVKVEATPVPRPQIAFMVRGRDNVTHRIIFAKKGTPGFTPIK